MSVASSIRRFIFKHPIDKMFTTRQLLAFGSRTAIDQFTSKLVHQGELIRITAGVFAKAGSDLSKITPLTVAIIKAAAFGKRIIEHASDTAERLGITGGGNDEPTFSTRGHSSSFLFLLSGERIFLKGVSARKFKLAQRRTGDALRALWNIGENFCKKRHYDAAILCMNRKDRKELHRLASLMPGWIHKEFDNAWG